MVHATKYYAYPNVHAPFSYLPHIHLKAILYPDVIFQILLHCSRPIMLHHVTDHVTSMSCASSSSKIKEKEN